MREAVAEDPGGDGDSRNFFEDASDRQRHNPSSLDDTVPSARPESQTDAGSLTSIHSIPSRRPAHPEKE